MKIVKYRQRKLPSITKERKSELMLLADKPESEMDFSDIPELGDDFWKNAVRNPYYNSKEDL